MHDCQNYLGAGSSLGGSEKNRGTVITSLQLAFRRRDRNFTPFTIPLAMKKMPDTFSIDCACLQISPFETVILYSFWAFIQIKSPKMQSWNIFLIAALNMLPSPLIKTIKPPDKKAFLHRRTVKFQFVCQKLCFNIPLAELLQKHVGLLDLSAKYQKSLVCLRKDVPYGRFMKAYRTTTCERLQGHPTRT